MSVVSGMKWIASKIGGQPAGQLKQYYHILEEIEKFNVESMDEGCIKARSLELIGKARQGAPLADLLVESFALGREAAWRVLGMRPFDTQVIAGMALYQGNLIEMPTGEGKTLTAVLPSYLNALPGRGMHIFTFNDYLARRDAEWMGPVYRFLGLTVGIAQNGVSAYDKQAAYAADVTYVTAKEAGFDFLRDSLCYGPESLVHRPFNCVLVDEADSILIDEARMPLVIAGDTPGVQDDVRRIAQIVKGLKPGIDYDTDEYKRNVYLTDEGIDKIEAVLGCGNLFDGNNIHLLTTVNCAIHAETLLRRDVDYIIRDGRVQLVDEFTGRIAYKSRWPEGLQGAVEAKEGLVGQTKGRALAKITVRHFISLYPKVSGMTATAKSSTDEFGETYSLNVVRIPPHLPCIRVDDPDRVFTHKEPKYRAVVAEVTHVHEDGRPILIGTASVEESDLLAADLKKSGIDCHVLNAKNDAMEADVIAKAGEMGAVTVSTNMAGRGVDIRLGGGRPDEWAKVAGLGGLYVIGTNRHESVRIDKQLRGRAGRQGDPGSSRFFISLEDDLLTRFGIDKAIPAVYRTARQDLPLESTTINKTVAHIQRVVNGENFLMRKNLDKYSYILEQQRRIVHEWRRNLLMSDEPLRLLFRKEPELFYSLCRIMNQKQLDKLEREVVLFHVDQYWANHLEYTAYVQEGIHLVAIAKASPVDEFLGVGRNNPLDEFHRLLIDAFSVFPQCIEDETIKTFQTIKVRKRNIDFPKDFPKAPSATWTYVVTDNYRTNKLL